MTRVLVCGGREFVDEQRMNDVLDGLCQQRGIAVVIQGGQKRWLHERRCYIGADYFAGAWAKSRGVPCIEEPADWATYGRAAGPKRNQLMLDEHLPDIVVAFAGGRGTADMMRRAREAGLPVIEVTASPAVRGSA